MLKIATRQAGVESRCLRCHQRLIVPTPVEEPALPGILVEEGPPSEPPGSPEHDSEPPRDRTDENAPFYAWEEEEDVQVKRHNRSPFVTLLAFIYLFSGLVGLVLCGLIALGGRLAIAEMGMAEDRRVAGGVLVIVCILIMILSLPDFLIAYGIYHRRPWGRIWGIIFGIISGASAFASVFWFNYCSFCVNSFLCIYSLVVLLMPQFAAEFQPRRFWRS
jgi:hypothetical protein